MKNKTAIILGTTGLVGGELVKQMSESGNYHKVEVWVRKASNKWPIGVSERVINFEEIDQEAINADEVFCCLGTTIKKAGSKEAFEKVDYLYPLKAAELAKTANVSLFAIVTAMGSNKSSRIFYNKVKGKVEDDLTKINFDHFGIFRPSMLLGDRPEFRLGELVGKVIMKLLNPFIPNKYQAIHASKVALAMLNYATQPSKGVSIVENQDML